VARYQHPYGAAIDWARVAASGQDIAIVKATEVYAGSGGRPVLYTNSYLHADLSGAHAAGLRIGAYAFAHPEFSATAQADDFAAAIWPLPSGSLPPVLDLETNGGLSVAALQMWTKTFLDRLEHDTGVVPMIYTGPAFWSTYMGGTTAFAHYPLWEAHWTSAPAPAQFGGWSTYTVWQFTDRAVVPGIQGYVDGNRIR
jgi:lysozyme